MTNEENTLFVVLTKKEIAEIVESTVKVTIEQVEKQKVVKAKSRQDKRLRNTKLLLENFSLLKDHVDNAVYDKKDVIATEYKSAIDILDSLEDYDDPSDYIQSIKDSVSRTKVIISHIDEMMKLYRIYCEESDKPEEVRKYQIMKKKYVDNVSPADICEQEGVEQSTYYRDSRAIVKTLSALIFGIDGLSTMTKR